MKMGFQVTCKRLVNSYHGKKGPGDASNPRAVARRPEPVHHHFCQFMGVEIRGSNAGVGHGDQLLFVNVFSRVKDKLRANLQKKKI